MSIVLGSIILLGVCLCAFVYLALRGMPAVGLRGQKRALAYVLIAGVLVAATKIRTLTESLLVGEVPYGISDLLFEIPAAALLVLAAIALVRSERGEISFLRRSASVDPLTALYNRAYFRRAATRRANLSREYEIPLSLAMLDIDDFDAIHESHGRRASDSTLRDVADILKRSVRADDLVARYGDEEFVMLLNCELDDAGSVFERVRSNVEIYSGTPKPVTVSIGISGTGEQPRDYETGEIEEMIQEADAALDRARRGGKNRVVLYPEVA